MESITLKAAGIAFTAILAVVGAAAVLAALGYGMFSDDGRIGAGFLPVVAGGLVAALAVVDLIGRLRRRSRPHHDAELALDTESIESLGLALEPELEAAASDVDIFGRTQKQRNAMLLAVAGILLVTVLLVGLVGFILAFGLMLFVIAVVIEKRKPLPSLIVTVIALGMAWLVFGVLLRVPLPQGLIGLI